jgi:hypothetical protein
MDIEVTKTISGTLKNAQILTQSLSCKLIPVEGPWHLCDCEKPEQFILADSKKALKYLESHSKIHIFQ